MSTLKNKTITSTYDQLIKRADTYSATGSRLELMDDSGNSVNSALYLDITNQRLGIGQDNPSYKLDVLVGDSNGVAFRAADAGLSTVIGTNSDGSGYITCADEGGSFTFRLDGKDNAVNFITNGGKLGIGTVTPDEALDVVGNIIFTGGSANDFSGVYASATLNLKIGSGAGDEGRIYIYGKTNGQSNAGDILLTAANQTNQLYLDATNGNIGIGTNAPYALLELGSTSDEDYSATTKTDAQLQGGTTLGLVNTNTDDENYAQILFRLNQTNTAIARIVAISESNNNVDLAFVSEGSDNATEKLRIKADGKVGIGTDGPVQELEVVGDIAVLRTDVSATRYIGIAQPSGDMVNSTASIGFISDGTDQQISFRTHNSGSSSGERMRIDEDGNVGIGITNPLGALHLPDSKGLYWGTTDGGVDEHGQIRVFRGEWDASASTTYDLAIGDDAQANHLIVYEALVVLRNSASTNGQAWKVYAVSKDGAILTTSTVFEELGGTTCADPVFVDTGTANVLRLTTHNNTHTTGYTVLLTQASVT
jgi:hypothetical protein